MGEVFKNLQPLRHRRACTVVIYFLLGVLLICSTVHAQEAQPPDEQDTIVNYTWTDENGAVHFSDQKSDPSAKEVISKKKPEGFIDKTVRDINYTWIRISEQLKYYGTIATEKTKSMKWIAAISLVAVFGFVVGFKLYRYHNRTGKQKQNRHAVQSVIQNFKYFRSSLTPSIDKESYLNKVSGIKSSFADFKKSYPDLIKNHDSLVALLDRSLQSYSDCTILWDIASPDDIHWADRNGYLMKYPALMGVVGQTSPARRDIMSGRIRSTVLKYASNFLDEAESAFSTFKTK